MTRKLVLPALRLYLTPGGSAELVAPELLEDESDSDADAIVWDSREDADFLAQFGNRFLGPADVGEILEFLVSVEEITQAEADGCEIIEEFANPVTAE